MTNAEKIQQWRDANPGEVLTAAALQTILDSNLSRANLSGANLSGANLSGANLHRANLRFANLRFAKLRGAYLGDTDMRGAVLYGANLRGADLGDAQLSGANLRGANLYGANLYGADLHNNAAGILIIDGAHPYRAELVPTPYGWVLTIGCWKGTIDELRALIAQDEGWPEATGEDVEERRPILEAIADLCDAHIARHAGLIDDLAKRWNS